MNTSPKILLNALLAIAIFSCEKDDTKKGMDELPDDVFKMNQCAELYTNIYNKLQEGKNEQERNRILFMDQSQQRLVLTQEADVYVSFVAERSEYSNTLGWYTYQDGGELSLGENANNQIVFPHFSSAVLTPGDGRRIGRFPAGTVVGFFLVVGGWDAEMESINFDNPTFYCDLALNARQTKQNILFIEEQCGDVVVAFEDKLLWASDLDYNDAVIRVTDNDQNFPATSFSLEMVPSL